jgi:hypothetical protein
MASAAEMGFASDLIFFLEKDKSFINILKDLLLETI